MKARLIAVTRTLPDVGVPESPEALVIYCARVSSPHNQHNHGTGEKLLHYLMREAHWSPFEMAHAVVEVEAPRDIARQILRHRSFAFQEFSQRYAAAYEGADRAIRRQDHKNRQSSHDDLPRWKRALWRGATALLVRYVSLVYTAALKLDVAKETARVILPEGLTMSRLYMAGSLRSWLHYLAVREGSGTQSEHIEIARMIRAELAREFPLTFGDRT
jgi:thymidylate synthase (FAD)